MMDCSTNIAQVDVLVIQKVNLLVQIVNVFVRTLILVNIAMNVNKDTYQNRIFAFKLKNLNFK